MVLSVVSVGVKVTLSEGVPTGGIALPLVQAKVPPGVELPLLRVDVDKAAPYVIEEAVGQVTAAVPLFTLTVTVPVAVL